MNTITMEVQIPSEIQERINCGDYTLNGNQIRDKKGRIVCNLNSIIAEDKHYFSPSIFIKINNLALISNSIIPSRLEEYLDNAKSRLGSIDQKLERILKNQFNEILSKIGKSKYIFNRLRSGSSLTDAKDVFIDNVDAAFTIASHIPSYFNDYLNKTIVHHSAGTEEYSQFITRDNRRPKILKTEFSIFQESPASFLAHSFMELINNINMLSLCFDKKTFPEYEKNLTALKDELAKLLSRLIIGLGEEGDIYDMLYTYPTRESAWYAPPPSRRNTKIKENYKEKYPHHFDIIEIIKYDTICLDDVIKRNYEVDSRCNFDANRIKSIWGIITMLEDVANLLKRNHQMENLDLISLSELSDIKRKIFN